MAKRGSDWRIVMKDTGLSRTLIDTLFGVLDKDRSGLINEKEVHSYGLYSHGLYSYGLCRYGLFSYGSYLWPI